MLKKTSIVLIVFLLFLPFFNKAQLYSHLEADHHNSIFINTGFQRSFLNYSFGIIHTKYQKRLKRDLTEILELTLPYSNKIFNTQYVFRKGLQINIYQSKTFNLPFSMISSSINVHGTLFKIHDLVTDFNLLPGIYTDRITLALDLNYKLIWFRKSVHNENYHVNVDSTGSKDFSKATLKSQFSLGFVAGINRKRFSFVLRGGYQTPSEWEKEKIPFYAVIQTSFHFNFIKHKEKEISKDEPGKQE